nr:hypothetical protein [Helicobacter pylori]
MKRIKKPYLDYTQALSSYVSGSIGTLKAFLAWVRKYFLTHALIILAQKH